MCGTEVSLSILSRNRLNIEIWFVHLSSQTDTTEITWRTEHYSYMVRFRRSGSLSWPVITEPASRHWNAYPNTAIVFNITVLLIRRKSNRKTTWTSLIPPNSLLLPGTNLAHVQNQLEGVWEGILSVFLNSWHKKHFRRGCPLTAAITVAAHGGYMYSDSPEGN